MNETKNKEFNNIRIPVVSPKYHVLMSAACPCNERLRSPKAGTFSTGMELDDMHGVSACRQHKALRKTPVVKARDDADDGCRW